MAASPVRSSRRRRHMTEVPEHLLKRAQAAKDKARRQGGRRRWRRRGAGRHRAAARRGDSTESRIPAHLLERSKAAKAKKDGGAAAEAGGGVGRAPRPAAAWRRSRRLPPAAGPGRSHPAPADGRQVRVDPGRQGQAPGQGPRLAAPADRRVRRRAVHDGVHHDLLDLRERAAARARQLQRDAPTRPRRRGTSWACRSCSRCSTRWSPV